MKKFFSAVLSISLFVGFLLFQVSPAQAISCTQRDLLLANALSRGDIAAAAQYRNMSCTSGSTSSGTSSGTALTCTQRNLNIANALTKGDLATAAYWQSLSCVSSGSSGSSGSGSSGSSNNNAVVTPVKPPCTAGPNAPTLKVTAIGKGVRIEVTPDPSGETAIEFQWEVTYYNGGTATWGPWSGWNTVSATPFTQVFRPRSAEDTRIAFGVYARNTCGYSQVIRENEKKNGVDISSLLTDSINVGVSIPKTLSTLTRQLDISPFVSALSGAAITMNSLTPKVCSVSGSNVVALAAGICNLQVSTTESEVYKAAGQVLSLKVTSPQKSIICVKKTKKTVKLTVIGANPVCPAGYQKG